MTTAPTPAPSAPEDGLSPLERHKALDAIWTSGRGLQQLSAVNHTTLGIRIMLTACFFFFVGGLLAMLIRAQLSTPDTAFLDAPAYAQVFTMHGTVMMFLFAIPLLEGIAMYLLPKMLGTRDLAFPRLTAYGYWCYLFGGLTLLAALVLGVAPMSGWFMYTPLSSDVYSPGINSDIWLLGITFVEISAVSIGVELTVTILRMRAPGMSLARMPIFAWYMLVTALMIVVGFPPLIAGSLMLEAERAFGLPFFDPTRGGDPLLWQHLFWIFGHPEVYIIFLPAAGMLATLVPTFSRRPLVAYKAVVAAVLAMGVISFLIWAHHMFTVGMPKLALDFFAVSSSAVVLPTAIQIFALIATMAMGKVVRSVPMLYVMGFFIVFVNGGLTGVMVAVVPFNFQVHDTAFVTAHLHYVLIGSLVFGSLAGLYYWLPHLTGRMSVHSLSIPAFWLIFLGFNGTFLLMHLTGLLGMPRRVHSYFWDDGWATLNLISSVGGFIQAMGFGLVALDVILTRRHGPRFRRDPWKAGTLEWATPTPAPSYAFGALPNIETRADKLEPSVLGPQLAAGDGYLARPRGWMETMVVDTVSGKADHIAILPQRTYMPLIQGLVTFAGILCLLFKAYLLAAGIALLLAALFILAAQGAGLGRDHGPLPAGRGLSLPPHPEVRNSLPTWGLRVTLLANGAMFASLGFGVLYLRLTAPGWPPPPEAMAMRGPGVALAALAAVLLIAVAAGLSRATIRANDKGEPKGRWMLFTAGALAVATALVFWLPASGHLPDPRVHALGATLNGLAAYVFVHAAIGLAILASNAFRSAGGWTSPRRGTDFLLTRMWLDYTAATAAISVGLAALVV
ncbi:cytochrome c oxidase subunit I [Paracoccus sp. MC1854]|uniref:cytochrome c oxidase subunit I n=1 Tax=Paracoccus sp. MC1854 TaxID=2760306 RepID=UPI00160318E1|nr:cytochrome c oxidase subunit I [Paracoccus sp. MC1854]MBB1490925.1 cytochrome c oxidase subunit I [Paracoccus sp. MC1854]